MYKATAADIISLLETRLSSDSFRGMPIPPSLQVLITLRFLACGTFHRETGNLCGVSEQTVCKIVHKVCKAICELKDDYIKFPDAAGQANYKVEFFEYGKFPGVIGCIDGCHILIKCPSTADSEEYRNHKNWFSINVCVHSHYAVLQHCCMLERCNSWLKNIPELLSVRSVWRWST